MDGFIPGTRGSFMLDVVALAMIAILPVLVFGVQLARRRKRYGHHRKVMLSVSGVLGVAVVLFEVEMRLAGWRHRAEPSPFYETYVPIALIIHLVCAVSTSLLLVATVWMAARHFATPPRPNYHSQRHKRLGTFSTIGLFLTSITGWIFYYLAFLA
jgi:putative membrane protein